MASPVAPRAGSDLQVGLDFPLPRALSAGRPTALFVCGWCFSPRARIRSLAFAVDGQPQPVTAQGMPRGDVFRALHPTLDPFATGGMSVDPESPDDPLFHGFRSGFWGFATIPAGDARECALLLRARLADGSEEEAAVWRFELREPVAPPAVPPPEPAAGPFVAIGMAIHEPPIDLFRRQVESIRAQTHRNWVCVVSDDCSNPESFEEVRELLADDPRFLVSRSPRRLGFYENFERALALAPAEADYVAMADQDDRWYPDKLETLLERIGPAQLVYSDARIVDRHGTLVSDSYWDIRRNNHTSLLSLLIANSVTGAASLFRRETLDRALPFPPGQFGHFHDHWVALVALSLGEIEYVDRPLYDYVQHRVAVLGHAYANRMPALRERLQSLRRPLPERVRHWRHTFFVDCCRLMQVATILELRCGDRMTEEKRRDVERLLRVDRSAMPLALLAGRGARELVGRTETLGAEVGLFFAFAWRHLLTATTLGLDRPRRRLRMDARPPAKVRAWPGNSLPDSPSAREVAQKIAPLELAVGDDVPERVNILIPSIDLDHFFGGYIGKLNLARRLAERGARVRIVTVDPVGALPPSWTERVESYSGLADVFDNVEVAFGREAPGIEVSRSDRFIATTWWTAHLAHSALRSLGGEGFLYMVQEYEPFTFPMGAFAALASESYGFPHHALFSTELLRGYFRDHGIGVYAAGAAAGDAASVAFQNAITPVDPPPAAELARRRSRRLLFYARPEAHASRNMFELGVLALGRLADEGTLQGWDIRGIGAVRRRGRIGLGGGASLELLPRRGQEAYADLLPEHDVGLALMYTPHPSLAPIEMASAGMLTVTNSFENKTPEAMSEISSNLITVEPTVDAIADGLREAVAGVGDAERRARGSRVNWSRDWDQSFGDELMERVEGLLEA